jgi:hypothetical protein
MSWRLGSRSVLFFMSGHTLSSLNLGFCYDMDCEGLDCQLADTMVSSTVLIPPDSAKSQNPPGLWLFCAWLDVSSPASMAATPRRSGAGRYALFLCHEGRLGCRSVAPGLGAQVVPPW